jgi:hypothetical protein
MSLNSILHPYPGLKSKKVIIIVPYTVLYTDTKLNGLFRAPARVSVIKLFLARNTISFCGLKKLSAIARSSPGIFENLY